MAPRPSLGLVVDPRFGGGTSSAVAREIRALAPVADLRVAFIESKMFRGGRMVHAGIAEALAETGVPAVWNPDLFRAETVVIHNPSFLKFDTAVHTRFNCARALVVAHENFLRPGGDEGFDVGATLRLIAGRLPPCDRWVAPVSAYNRRRSAAWLAAADPQFDAWKLAPFDWFNICDFPLTPPTPRPRDRRGRVSRPGFEKFPDLATMQRHFPPAAEVCAILGADTFLLPGSGAPAHWRLVPFGGEAVPQFLSGIDFFVYFTHPALRESFGRVLAEAIAAGKVVITDPGTAETFGPAVVASDGRDVDAIIAGFLADPGRYQAFVRAAQRHLAGFSADSFRQMVLRHLSPTALAGEAA
jgi:glycosyltransferase involved in cell wall biosynthesis